MASPTLELALADSGSRAIRRRNHSGECLFPKSRWARGRIWFRRMDAAHYPGSRHRNLECHTCSDVVEGKLLALPLQLAASRPANVSIRRRQERTVDKRGCRFTI